MRRPRLASFIERRLLVNYRVDPATIEALLPAPLRPQQVDGWGVAGICLIRLGQVRPSWLPGVFGLRSENAAHRIAVEWDGPNGLETGVYIPRRDSGSAVNVLVGGRLFPGSHRPASFDVRESSQDLHVAFAGRDGTTRVSVDVSTAPRFEGSKLFADLDQASAFFKQGSAGFSTGHDPTHLDGLELNTNSWHVEPLTVHNARSTFFDDQNRFPQGSATLDCALLMRDVPVTWHPLRPMTMDLRRPGGDQVGDRTTWLTRSQVSSARIGACCTASSAGVRSAARRTRMPITAVVTPGGLGARWGVRGASPVRAWLWRWMRRVVRS